MVKFGFSPNLKFSKGHILVKNRSRYINKGPNESKELIFLHKNIKHQGFSRFQTVAQCVSMPGMEYFDVPVPLQVLNLLCEAKFLSKGTMEV